MSVFLSFRNFDACPISGFDIVLFVCLFVCLFRIFLSFGYVTIAGEGLQILTFARHSWLLSSEGSLACHTYCDASVYNGHLRGPVTLTPFAEPLAAELALPVFKT